MKLPEGFTPPQAEIEKAEKEIASKSPKLEIAEINNEQLEQYTVSTKLLVEQEAREILPKAEKRMESSAQSMNVSPEIFDVIKQESGLDAQLQKVQTEADQLANEAKSDIASVVEKPEPEKNSEVRQQTPEEIKEKRRMEIIKEIEKEWEAKNGPMERSLSEREIEKNKVMARLRGKEWDGRTTQLTEAANEFFFDHRGMGKSSVPKRADKILAEKFPEYAQKAEQKTQNEQKKTKIEIPNIRIVEETPRTPFEIPKVVSEEEVVSKMSEQLKTAKESGIAFDEAALQERQKALVERSIIDSNAFREATAVLEEKPTFSWVEINKIVGRPFGDQNPGGWSFEYGGRKGRIVEIAKDLSEADQDKQKIEHVFHLGKPNERIKLSVLEGPSGPMYSVEDGTHRIAGAMVAKLNEIPCDVKRIKYPLERVTASMDDVNDWQKKIEFGLIQGKIEPLQNDKGEKFYKLVAQKEVLPWVRTVSQNKLIKISRTYEKLYPGSLNKLDVPRDALIDPIANNYFMAGRWKEWEKKFSQKPRDNNRMVIYS